MHCFGNDDNSHRDMPGGFAPPNVRRSPSGRIPQWAIDEAYGRAEAPSPWRGAEAPHRRRKKFRSRAGRQGSRSKRTTPSRTVQLRTVLGIALVVCLYFTPTLFDRVVLPAAAPYLPGATMPPPGWLATVLLRRCWDLELGLVIALLWVVGLGPEG